MITTTQMLKPLLVLSVFTIDQAIDYNRLDLQYCAMDCFCFMSIVLTHWCFCVQIKTLFLPNYA